jgi:hypothetical protein
MIAALLKDHKIDLSINVPNVFTIGTLVKIADELPMNMQHFTAANYAVILERSATNIKYSLFILSKDNEGIVHGEITSWYPHEVLTMLEGPTPETMAIVNNAHVLICEEDEDGDEDEDSDEV